MSDVLPPVVVGPLSTANSFVRIVNHRAGANLAVFGDGKLIGSLSGARGGSDDVVLTRPLIANEGITATQDDPTTNAPASEHSSPPLVVQVLQLGQTRFNGRVYRCAVGAWVFGSSPGVGVEIHQPPGTVIARGESYNGGGGVLGLLPGGAFTTATPLVVRETHGGATKDSVYPLPIAEPPLEPGRQLRRVQVSEARDCSHLVRLAGTVHGAGVTVFLDRPGEAQRSFGGIGADQGLGFWVGETVKEHDILTATQMLDTQCEVVSSDPVDRAEAGPGHLGTPVIVEPLCEGARQIMILGAEAEADFEISAIFELRAGGEQRHSLGKGQFPRDNPGRPVNIGSIPIEPNRLPGSRVRLDVVQSACGRSSQSGRAEMGKLPPSVTPEFLDPPLACAMKVRVGSVSPGTWVTIHSAMRGGDPVAQPAGGQFGEDQVPAGTTEISVALDQPLLPGDTVWARISGCGSETRSKATGVTSAGTIRAGIREPVYAVDDFVWATNLTTGAQVFAVVRGPDHPNGEDIYSSVADGPERWIYVGNLFESDTVQLLEYLCDVPADGLRANGSNTAMVVMGEMDVTPVASMVVNGYFSLNVAAKDHRYGSLVNGSVEVDGVSLGATNRVLGSKSPRRLVIAIRVRAAGYRDWIGTLTLTVYQQPSNPPRSTTGPGSGGLQGTTPGLPVPTYTYSCDFGANDEITITVDGAGFANPGAGVTVSPGLLGIFRTAGPTQSCAQLNPKPPIWHTNIKADKTFQLVQKWTAACEPGCEVSIGVEVVGYGGITSQSGTCSCP